MQTEEPKDHIIPRIRITKSEYEKLIEDAKGLPLTTYMRKLAGLNHEIPIKTRNDYKNKSKNK